MWGFGPMYRFYFNRYRSSATPSGWVVDACDVEDFLVNVQRFYELGPTDRWALSSHDPRGPAGGFTIDVTELQSTSVIAEWLGKVGAGVSWHKKKRENRKPAHPEKLVTYLYIFPKDIMYLMK